MMKTYIGVDLGGTNVRAAIVDDNGTILQMEKTLLKNVERLLFLQNIEGL